MLGVSVGVDVQELLASSSPQPGPSNQSKIGREELKKNELQINKESLQQKLDPAQRKPPALQDKKPVLPGVSR